MIEDPEEEHVIEQAHGLGRQFLHIQDAQADLGADQAARHLELLQLEAVHGDDIRAPALQLEAAPAGPRANVEDAPAAQVLGDGESVEPLTQLLDAVEALDEAAVGEFDAMEPALPGQVSHLVLDDLLEARVPRQPLAGHALIVPETRLNSTGVADFGHHNSPALQA